MALDLEATKAVEIPESTLTLERGRLIFFARAIGETDPVYLDVDAARAAGHPDIPAPPTFLFAMEAESPFPFAYAEQLGFDPALALHGQQSFTYDRLAYAGDELVCRSYVVDAYAKTPTMDFVIKRSEIFRGDERVLTAESLLILRSGVTA
ncbi:MaoC family dehydratase N-terminal domain-containing protein [Thermopolyspora sp. NPDC052614]|uniref:FAS1-like dehydratase domain-containing protein n=1 Tax=Thermopolyspora sp. NPDC052614 TaxID=3155682 RepID=UPI0034261F65